MMVAVENLNSEAKSFDFEILILKMLILSLETGRLRLKKKKLNLAAKNFDMTVVVAYMNFGSDSALRSLIIWSRSSESSSSTAEAASKISAIITSGRI